MRYRQLAIDECSLLAEIDRSEFIEKVWRLVNGEWMLKKIDYEENDWPGGIESYVQALRSTLESGGVVLGAFDDNSLVGVASLNREFFGETAKYVLLDNMFVSKESRGKGIGKRLTQMCCDQARRWGADKLYACAASSESTVAFYRALGFVNAIEINQSLYELDPRDIQLEYDLAFKKLSRDTEF